MLIDIPGRERERVSEFVRRGRGREQTGIDWKRARTRTDWNRLEEGEDENRLE